MSHLGGRIVIGIGLLSALVLVPVGVMMSVFGFAQAAIGWLGLGGSEANRQVVFGIIGATMAFHAVPLVLFGIAWSSGSAARVWLGLTMLLLSPVFGWVGFYGLILRGDWGDFVLWGGYLLTGLFMALVGALIIAGRWDS